MEHDEILAGLKGRIVAGCDGSTQAADAAGWGAQRAVERNQGLTLLVATGRPDDVEPGLLFGTGLAAELVAGQERRVQAMTDELRARNPGLDVDIVALPERAAPALVAASLYADPLVIGTRGLGRVSGHIVGAVADQVVTHGSGTIVVVPTRVWHMPGQQEGAILVGYDFSPAATHAMNYAFAEAATSGLPVKVIRAVEFGELWDLRPTDVLGGRDPLAAYEDQLEAAIRPWRERYPQVNVTAQVRQGGSASALLADESVEASMVVVGNRGLGGFAGLLLGSTTRRLLHHARCPVVVIR